MDYTKLIKKINNQVDGEDPLRLRVGVVTAVAVNGTVTVTVSGVSVPGVPVLDGATMVVGAVVQIISLRGSLMVIGSSGGTSGTGASRDGVVHGLSATGATAGVTAETVVMTGAPANTVFYGGRVYEITIYGAATTATATSFRVRKAVIGGQQLMDSRNAIDAGNTNIGTTSLFKVAAGSNVTTTLVVTLQAITGAGAIWTGGSGFPRGFYVKDVGAESNPAFGGVYALT